MPLGAFAREALNRAIGSDRRQEKKGGVVELVRHYTVVHITVHPDTWTNRTLDRMKDKTSWRPQDACFAPKG